MIAKFKRVAADHPDWPLILVAAALLAAWWMQEDL